MSDPQLAKKSRDSSPRSLVGKTELGGPWEDAFALTAFTTIVTAGATASSFGMDISLGLVALTSLLIPVQPILGEQRDYGSSPLKTSRTHIPIELKSKRSKAEKTQPEFTSSMSWVCLILPHLALCTRPACYFSKESQTLFFLKSRGERGGCEQPSIGSGNQILVLWKDSKHSRLLGRLSALSTLVVIQLFLRGVSSSCE